MSSNAKGTDLDSKIDEAATQQEKEEDEIDRQFREIIHRMGVTPEVEKHTIESTPRHSKIVLIKQHGNANLNQSEQPPTTYTDINLRINLPTANAKVHTPSMVEDEISINSPDETVDRIFRKISHKRGMSETAIAKAIEKTSKKSKIQVIQAAKVYETSRKKESGQAWAERLSNNNDYDGYTSAKTLQTLVVVLQDEDKQFVKDFISNLGLKHICRLGKSTTTLDLHLLSVLKAIIDCEQSTKSLINHDLAIRMIVQKINSNEIRVRELALQLLVSLMVINRINTDLISKAANDIMSCMSGWFLCVFCVFCGFWCGIVLFWK